MEKTVDNALFEVRVEIDRLKDVVELMAKFEQHRVDSAKQTTQYIDLALRQVNDFERKLLELETRLTGYIKEQDQTRSSLEAITEAVVKIEQNIAVLLSQREMVDRQIEQLSIQLRTGEERRFTKRGMILSTVVAFLAGLLPSLFEFWKYLHP